MERIMSIDYETMYRTKRFYIDYSKRWKEWRVGVTSGFLNYYFDNTDMRHLLFAIADYLGYGIPRKHVPKAMGSYGFNKAYDYNSVQFMVGCKRFKREDVKPLFKILLDHFDYELI